MWLEKNGRNQLALDEESDSWMIPSSVLDLIMIRRYIFFCFLFLLSLTTCITVRMTDRKPKWAVMKEQEETEQKQREEELSSIHLAPDMTQSSMPSFTPPPPLPTIDFDSIPRRRGFEPVSGERWESLVHSRTGSAFFPPKCVHRFQQQ